MKRFFLTWWKLLSVLSLGAVILGTAIWHTTRPVALDPEALTLSQLPPSCPGAQLRLELSPHRISTATFFNGSDLTFYHGDPPDYCGVDVQLNGQWYDVPCRDFVTAGTGMTIAPGEQYAFTTYMEPYGTLPDGHYRLCFGYWQDDDSGPLQDELFYVSAVPFDIQRGRYVSAELP